MTDGNHSVLSVFPTSRSRLVRTERISQTIVSEAYSEYSAPRCKVHNNNNNLLIIFIIYKLETSNNFVRFLCLF